MKTFEYRGFDRSGVLSRGLVEALDAKDARERLANRGILTEKVNPAGEFRARWWQGGSRTFDLSTRALVYREWSSLLTAGLPMDRAMEVLIETPELGSNISLLAQIRDRVREGSSLADALRGAQARVTDFESSLIEVGERTGSLDQVLDRLACFLEDEAAIRERIVSALVYPCFILALALVVAVVMLGIMIPSFEKLLTEVQMELPLLTRSMLATGKFLAGYGWVILALIAAVVYYLYQSYRQDARWRHFLSRRAVALPLWGRTYIALLNLRFARTLSLLLRGGVAMPEAMELAGRATGNAWVGDAVRREAESVRQGDSLAAALRRVTPLADTLPGWISAGEASGDLQGMLENAAARYQRTWEKRMTRLLSLIEPLLVLAVGLFVLLVALAVLQPILSLNQSLAP